MNRLYNKTQTPFSGKQNYMYIHKATALLYLHLAKTSNQGFYVRLPTRACRTGYWGRRDLIDHNTLNNRQHNSCSKKWTMNVPILCRSEPVLNSMPRSFANLIAAEKMDNECVNFMSLQRSIEPYA